MTENSAASRTPEMAPLTDVRERLSEIIDDVNATGSDLIITKHGRPAAVVLGYREYESLIETLNILSDADAMIALAEAEANVAADEIFEMD